MRKQLLCLARIIHESDADQNPEPEPVTMFVFGVALLHRNFNDNFVDDTLGN